MSEAVGMAAAGVAVLLFGTVFVPVRRFDAGDGIFVQWMMSMAIMFIGFVVFALRGFPGFFPLAMLGGIAWTVGNVTAVPIFDRLGMALPILIWSVVACVTGWAGGRFGLFGMNASIPASPLLNYLGLICVVLGGFLFSRIESTPVTVRDEYSLVDKKEKQSPDDLPRRTSEQKPAPKPSQIDRIVGFVLSIGAGLLYGNTFVPVVYMIDNPDKYPGYPTRGLDYVFSYYFGIFVTSSAIFVGYAIFRRNRPVINAKIALPAYSAGLIFGSAQALFFVANEHLSQTVTFPIIVMLPGCIVSLWSIFYFKEITGKRNYMILIGAMSVTLCGVILVSLSKDVVL